jgi:hypothetical protein
MAKKKLEWNDSDAPDAKGKFRDLSPEALANWLIKTRRGNVQKINGSLMQQINFNKRKDPEYASKMRKTREIAMNKLDKDKSKGAAAMYSPNSSPITAVRKTKEGLKLKRWLKEEWKDEKGNDCGSDKNKNTKVCRPSKRVNKDSPKPWSEMTAEEKNKVKTAKQKVGMGKRRASSSNVSMVAPRKPIKGYVYLRKANR